MSRTVALNTVAYQQVMSGNPSLRQADLLHELKSLGFDYVEIRREYIASGEEELPQIAAIAKEEKVKLFYSVPDELFKNNEVNPALEGYFKEAALVNALQMKVTLGDLDKLTKQTAEQINQLLHDFPTKLLIENDNSKERGSAARLKAFMEEAVNFGLALGLTFDVANFVYFDENPVENAKILNQYVHYIHIKNVKRNEGKLEGTDMESGDLDIQAILNQFPENIPCAIEYPCGDQNTITPKLQHDKTKIQSWVPVTK